MIPDLEPILRELLRAPGSLERWRDGAACPDEMSIAALVEGTLPPARTSELRAHLSVCGHCVLLAQAALEELAAIGAEHAEPALTGAEHAEPAMTGAEHAEPAVTGAEHAEPAVTGAEPAEPAVTGAEPAEPAVTGAEHAEPAGSRAEHAEPAGTGAEPAEPAAIGAEPAEPAVMAAERARPAGDRARLALMPRLFIALAAAAALVLALSQLWRGSGEPQREDISRLARIEALRVVIPRGEPEDEAEAAYRRGLEHYRDGDFSRAAEEFEAAVPLAPGRGDVRLYLGSALLLLGRPEEAGQRFAQAVPLSFGPQAEEAVWQSAQAHLAAGDLPAGRRVLELVAARESHRTADAVSQLAELPEP